MKRKKSFPARTEKHTGDNAAMIAFCAAVDPVGLWPNDSQRLSFIPNLLISDLPA